MFFEEVVAVAKLSLRTRTSHWQCPWIDQKLAAQANNGSFQRYASGRQLMIRRVRLTFYLIFTALGFARNQCLLVLTADGPR
jgi:hypothetical protein